MYKKQWHSDLERIGACCASVEYARQFATVRAAYDALDNIDESQAVAWLYWLAVRLTDRPYTMLDSMQLLVNRGVIGAMPHAYTIYIGPSSRLADLKAILPVPTARDLREACQRDVYPWCAVEM